MYLLKWNNSSREYEDQVEALSRALNLVEKEGVEKVTVYLLKTVVKKDKGQITRTYYTGL